MYKINKHGIFLNQFNKCSIPVVQLFLEVGEFMLLLLATYCFIFSLLLNNICLKLRERSSGDRQAKNTVSLHFHFS